MTDPIQPMNETEKNTIAPRVRAEALATHGRKTSKAVLEGAARVLAKAARALETLAERLDKKEPQHG